MKRIFVLATTLALILGIAASSFAETNTKVKTPNGKVMMLKVNAVKKQKRHHKHHRHHRKHRHHRNSMMKTKNI